MRNLNCEFGFGFFMGPKIWWDSDYNPYYSGWIAFEDALQSKLHNIFLPYNEAQVLKQHWIYVT